MRSKRYIFRYLKTRSLVMGFIVLTLFWWLQTVVPGPDKTLLQSFKKLNKDSKVRKVPKNNEPEYLTLTVSQKTSAAAAVIQNKEFFNPTRVTKIDWHNYTQIQLDQQRVGLGEHGQPVKLDSEELQHSFRLFYENGFNAAISDKIALNRSLPDVRHPGCKNKTYLESLPSVSIVIPFHNEHWTTLLRSLYSVINRSPRYLIKEIFIVDDGSTKAFLKEELDKYLEKHMPIVKVVRLAKRSGLITARLAGARVATADVIVFLDSHVEANVNWLPPLLEPIALNYKTVVCPYIDGIIMDTFEYQIQDEGARGGFNWDLNYRRMPLLPQNYATLPDYFESPVMAGGLFAISRAFFWELGGYDPGLEIWGGEQFELSFKIWQCGGRLLDAPCSHVGHIYRDVNPFPAKGRGDYVSRNMRRVIEVWMDEYKEFIYKRNPVLRQLNHGNLTEQKELRQRLKCKSFKWYMTQVAFDLMRYYPPKEPLPFAEGRIRPQGMDKLCVDAAHRSNDQRVLLTRCRDDAEQSFILSYHKDIRVTSRAICWDVPVAQDRGAVLLNCCHFSGGNQQWKYHEDTKLLEHSSQTCLDYDPWTLELFVDPCDEDADTQRWVIDSVNLKRLRDYDKDIPTNYFSSESE